MSADPSLGLSRFSAELRFARIPPPAVRAAKGLIADALAVAVAAGRAPGVEVILREIKGWGGREEASLLGGGGRVPAPAAALANGLRIHALEFDDTHDQWVVHPSACVLPAVLAASERRGGVNGEEFLSAFVAGVEVACRLGMAFGESLTFERTSLCGVFGAAAGAARAMGLPARAARHALGIALSYAGGTRQGLADGALTKRAQPGLAARGGIESANWAACGMTGPRDVFSGPSGFFETFGRMREGAEGWLEGLGERFEFISTGLKPYPCCRYVHPPIDAALELRREGGAPGEAIREVVVSVPPVRSLDYVARPFPLKGATTVDRQFSLSYVVALALLRGKVELGDFEEGSLPSDVAELLPRIRVERNEVQDPRIFFLPAALRVRYSSGEERSARCERLKGSPAWPMTGEEQRAKLGACLKYGGVSPLTESLWEAVQGLEAMSDIRDLSGLLDQERAGIV